MENEIEFRIEKLEVNKEEIEDEIKVIEKTIQELKELKNKISIKEISIKVNSFINDLEYDKEISEDIKEQIEKDIIFVRGLEDK